MNDEKKTTAKEKTPTEARDQHEKKRVPARQEKDERGAEPSGITPAIVRKARKNELVEFCEELELDSKGKVDELRKRLLDHLEKHPVKARKREKGKAEEEVEIEEEGAYVPKKKPTPSNELRAKLALRDRLARKRPTFLRQEWFRYRKLGRKWRKPHGNQSKLRRHFKYRINVVSIGYRGPVETRGLHPSGFKEVLVHNAAQLEGLDPGREAVRIAHAVGMRKRKHIEEVADDKGLRVLNRSDKSGS